jgi:hypothetical protein
MEAPLLPINRQMGKDNVVYEHMECHPAMRKHRIISFSGKWMELEIMLSIINPTQKIITACFLSYMEGRSKETK